MSSDNQLDTSSQTDISMESTSGRLTSDVYGYVDMGVDYTPRGKTKRLVWVCKSCSRKHVTKKWTSRNTGTFRKHLVKHHSDEYAAPENPAGNVARSLEGGLRHFLGQLHLVL